LQKALEVGAAAAYNLREMSHDEIVEDIRTRVGEVDLVFETMGQDRSPDQSGLDLAVKIVKPGGDVRLFTFSDTKHQFSIGDVLMKGINLVGRKVTTEKTRELLDLAQQWVAEGRYDVQALITHHVSLEDVEKGLKLAKQKPEETLKVIVDIC
jgi:threonine dehydrogenase-like Zn-dependent dehydrogenase